MGSHYLTVGASKFDIFSQRLLQELGFGVRHWNKTNIAISMTPEDAG